jgi:hypothetical protein
VSGEIRIMCRQAKLFVVFMIKIQFGVAMFTKINARIHVGRLMLETNELVNSSGVLVHPVS